MGDVHKIIIFLETQERISVVFVRYYCSMSLSFKYQFRFFLENPKTGAGHPAILDKTPDIPYFTTISALLHTPPHISSESQAFNFELSALSCKRSLHLGAKRLRRGQRSFGCIPSISVSS
jgi:hypothetical protein